MKPKVSIIVPIYNVEKYLPRCIESILAQTMKEIEVILVDDGSHDKCGAICEQYATKDERIRVIHKKNGGLSSARNAGIRIAQGDYVLFCDSDDYVHTVWCELLYTTALENPGAWVVCGVKKVADDFQLIKDKLFIKEVCYDKSYLDIYKMGLSGYSVNKIYSLQRLKENDLLFDEKCKFAEDVGFNVIYCSLCNKICYIPQELYFYTQRQGSILGKYYPNWFGLHLDTFYCRLPLMNVNEQREYCDLWLYKFHEMFKNVFDSRNNQSFFEKMHYNQKMAGTKEFIYAVDHASGKNESTLFLRVMRTHNYYLIWIFDILIEFKNKWRKRK